MQQKLRNFSRTGLVGIARSLVGMTVTLACIAGVTGCGSGSGPQAGTISVTDATGVIAGQLNSVAITSSAKVSLPVTNDPSNGGVDWAVICNGSPVNGSQTGGVCGTFAPAHTSDGAIAIYTAPSLIPLGTVVTVKASVTNNPSITRTTALSIVPLPISVSAVTGPTSMTVGTTASFFANSVNDAAGVIWSVNCQAGPCGSFSTNIKNSYTAPASVPTGGSVVITATSVTAPTQSASLTVSIVPPPPSGAISVNLAPLSFFSTTSGTTHNILLTATVLNDSAEQGLTWTCMIGTATPCATANFVVGATTNDVGTATFADTAVIPANSTITITAQAKADTTKQATAQGTTTTTTPTVTVISFSAKPPATLAAAGAPLSLTATAAPATQPINWTATCSATDCGSFSKMQTTSGTATIYTPPATVPAGNPVVLITAMSAAAAPAKSNAAYGYVTITPPGSLVAFVQLPPSTPISTLAQAPISATVTNDSTPPAGVVWSVSCGSTASGACGWIQPHQTANGAMAIYTAPPFAPSGPVTITATSAASSAASASANVTVQPATARSIQFVPGAPAQLPGYAVVNLSAAVTNDTTNAGVDWTVCVSGCGFFTTSPAIAEIPATSTTPLIAGVPAVTTTHVTAWPSGLPITYTAPLASSQGQTVTITAAAHVDPSVFASANVAIINTFTGPRLRGIVQAGTAPVAGASVALYMAGTTGYGSSSAPIYAFGSGSYAITDANGNFSLNGGYQCPQGNSQMYLVATGGKVGANQGNPNLAMMTALGSCSTLSSSPVVINEVTTVASAWSLAPFAANDALTGTNSYLNIGSSSANVTGLANAFASVNNLIDVSTGQARYTVPAGNATVPFATINTLANILNTCTASSGGARNDGTPCGTLFNNVPLISVGALPTSAVPTDTLQAAFNLAQHPQGNMGYGDSITVDSTVSTFSSPFQPILLTAPNDWSLALNFGNAGGLTASSAASSFAIDASGDLWITDTAGNRVIEWSNSGAPISPSTGFSAGGIVAPGPVAIDALGSIWISGNNSLTELTTLGTPAYGSPFASSGGGLQMAFDGLSNLWITNGTGVLKFSDLGVELSPAGGYINNGVTGTLPIAIDDSNNVLVGNTANVASLAVLNNASGQLVVNTPDLGDVTQGQLGVDGSGSTWVPSGNAVCKLSAYAGLGSVDRLASCYTPTTGGNGINSLAGSRGIAIDGAGMVWVGNAGGVNQTGIMQPPNLTEIDPALLSDLNIAYESFNLPSPSASPRMVAVDNSGNVWVLLANSTVTEYIGVATPVVTPTGLAIQKKKIGQTP